MKVTVILIIIGALGTVTIGLVQGLEELEKRVIQIKALSRYEESRGLDETCCFSDSSRKPSANAGVKNDQMSEIIKAQ